MKKMKKLASLVLALAMALTLAVPALAAEEKGSITINDAVVGQTYTVYQILDLESYNAEANAYSYKATSDWSSFINSGAIKGVYVEVDSQGYVTWKDGADAAAFAKLAQAYAKEKNTTASADAVTASSSIVKFGGLSLGYYLVDTTLGTLCSLNTTNPNVVMEEKNEVPTLGKQVQEDSTNNWGSTNDADIGQIVHYKTAIKLFPGSENAVMTDTMSVGLTYNRDVAISGLTVGTDYTVSEVTDQGFKLTFTKEYLDRISNQAGNELIVTYSATVNKNAKVGLGGNTNTANLQYGDENNLMTTPDSITTTYTWDMDVLKYANGDETDVLKDAKFVLLNRDTTKVATIEGGKVTGWVDIPAAGVDWPGNTVLTTGEDGKIEIDGLDADTYYLRETQAPAGYNKLANDVEVKITGATDGGDTQTYTTVVAKVNNKSGAQLPETGGMGTTLFYILGGVLVIGAGVAMVTKKRMA